MLFSICIPSYNRGQKAYMLIKQLLQMRYSETQLQIICSNNGSSKNVEGYKKLRKLSDERFVYHEFSENQGFAKNVNQVLKMAKGDFCMLLSDEDEIFVENFDNYIQYLQLHPEIGLMKGCTSFTYSDIDTRYISAGEWEQTIDACYMYGNYISGTIYNRDVITNQIIDEYEKKYAGEEAYDYYVHLFYDAIALLCGSFCSSDLLLIVEGMPVDSFKPGKTSPDPTVPEFGTYESRIAQMDGFLQQIKEFDIPAKIKFQMFIRVLERIAEQINIQKGKYISHGEDWNEIMEIVKKKMKEEIYYMELPFESEDIDIIEEHIDTIVAGTL